MAYDSTKPADDEYLSAFPAEAREQLRAIIEDQIVNALKLQGLVPGNASGQLPVSNGNVNANLNADQVDGKDASYFSPSTHGHSDATQNADGFMSKADKNKLDGVATGAEVNQNAFSNVAVGSITIQADGKQDTLTIVQGANITITADATNDRLTFDVSGTVPNATNAVTCTGNSATATKWQTARNIALTGNVTGSAAIDGSGDVSFSTTVKGIDSTVLAAVLLAAYPVGALYWSSVNTNPSTLFGGTWAQVKDKFILAAGDTYSAGNTGGEANHVLTTSEMPSHGHSGSTSTNGDHSHTVTTFNGFGKINGNNYDGYCIGSTDRTTSTAGNHQHSLNIDNTGGGAAHNNMPPYQVYYCWQRTA